MNLRKKDLQHSKKSKKLYKKKKKRTSVKEKEKLQNPAMLTEQITFPKTEGCVFVKWGRSKK